LATSTDRRLINSRARESHRRLMRSSHTCIFAADRLDPPLAFSRDRSISSFARSNTPARTSPATRVRADADHTIRQKGARRRRPKQMPTKWDALPTERPESAGHEWETHIRLSEDLIWKNRAASRIHLQLAGLGQTQALSHKRISRLPAARVIQPHMPPTTASNRTRELSRCPRPLLQ
jgi:hypothetical protein